MDYKDYYKRLGVSRNAPADEIKKQYRKLARKTHPDVNREPGAEDRFKEIAEAYEVLKDPEKRKAYDQFGAQWKAGQSRPEYQQAYQQPHYRPPQGAGVGGDVDFGEGVAGRSYGEFFETLFGGGYRPRGGSRSQSVHRKGEDMNASVTIPVEDAFRGVMRGLSFEAPSISATGAIEHKLINLNVKIPKGIRNGQKIRLVGQGMPGMDGGQAGDLYIRVDYDKHPIYSVDGTDVYLDLPVAPWEAALGASVDISTPATNLRVTIPRGSVQGQKLRLKGKGIPAKKLGDLYVVVTIVLPPANNQKAEQVYEDMKGLNFDPRANFRGG
jgi:curved DNA-binding protein